MNRAELLNDLRVFLADASEGSFTFSDDVCHAALEKAQEQCAATLGMTYVEPALPVDGNNEIDIPVDVISIVRVEGCSPVTISWDCPDNFGWNVVFDPYTQVVTVTVSEDATFLWSLASIDTFNAGESLSIDGSAVDASATFTYVLDHNREGSTGVYLATIICDVTVGDTTYRLSKSVTAIGA